jgi:hypothetical protein
MSSNSKKKKKKEPINVIIPGLIKMLAFDWSMTHWYKTHATGWLLRNVTGGLYVAIHDVKMV